LSDELGIGRLLRLGLPFCHVPVDDDLQNLDSVGPFRTADGGLEDVQLSVKQAQNLARCDRKIGAGMAAGPLPPDDLAQLIEMEGKSRDCVGDLPAGIGCVKAVARSFVGLKVATEKFHIVGHAGELRSFASKTPGGRAL
jgi:hypothetical protein